PTECLCGRRENTCTDTCSQSGSNAAVTVIQFHRYAGDFHENFGKEFAKEHIRLTCTDNRGIHPIFAEDIEPVAECISDTFLRRPEHLGTAVRIKIEVDKARTEYFVMQKALSTIAEWEDLESVAARSHRFAKCIHLCVGEAMSE